MGEAIEKTSRLYPGLLENNQNLLFMLKCRQFVEMVNGSDIDNTHRKSIGGYSPNYNISPRPNSPIQTSVIQSTKSFSNKGMFKNENPVFKLGYKSIPILIFLYQPY